MELTGEFRIPAPRETVWQALNDPEVLKQCIPGCHEVVKVSDSEFTARATLKVGPVKATFTGKVTLSDLDSPNGYRIAGQGQGGAAGFAKGEAVVALDSDGADTVLRYTVHATVGGKLAQIGSRVIDGGTKKMADDFFGRFTEIIAPGAAEEAAAPAVAAAVPGKVLGVSPRIWIAIAVVAVLVLIYALSAG